MKAPKEKFTIIFDFANFSISQVDLVLLKEGINILQNYYPERLGALFLVNYPWAVYGLWRMVKPLLDSHTADKIIFLDSLKKLHEHIPTSNLPSSLGGTSTFVFTPNSFGEETLKE